MHDTHLHQMSGQTSTTNETWGLWLIFLLHRAQDSNRISAKDLFLCENKPLDKAQHFLQVTGSVSRDPSAAQTRSFSDDGCDHGVAAVEKFNISATASRLCPVRKAGDISITVCLAPISTRQMFSGTSVFMHPTRREASGKFTFLPSKSPPRSRGWRQAPMPFSTAFVGLCNLRISLPVQSLVICAMSSGIFCARDRSVNEAGRCRCVARGHDGFKEGN